MQRLVAWLQHGMHEAVVEIVRECQCVHRDSVNKIMESEVQRLKIDPAQQVFWCDQNVDDLGLVPLCVDTGWQVTHEWLHNSTGLEITHGQKGVLLTTLIHFHESFMYLTHWDLHGNLLHCKKKKKKSLKRGGSNTETLETPQLQTLHKERTWRLPRIWCLTTPVD